MAITHQATPIYVHDPVSMITDRLRPSHRIGLLLLLITLLGALLRAAGLARTLWFDEIMLYWIAQGDTGFVNPAVVAGSADLITGIGRAPSWANLIEMNRVLNSAPPLYPAAVYLLSHLGSSEPVLRLLSWAAGTAAIPVHYWLARTWLRAPAALGVALLVAVAPVQVAYSYELREYSLAVLLAAALIGATARFWNAPTWGRAARVSLLMVVSLATQYGLALLILSLNGVIAVALLVTRLPRAARLRRWSIAQLPPLLTAGAVYLSALGDQLQAGGFAGDSYLAAAYWDGSASGLARLAVDHTLDIWHLALGSVWGVGVFALGSFLLLLRQRADRRWLAACLLLPFLLTLTAALLRLYPYHADRQLLFLTPMLYVTVGLVLDTLLFGATGSAWRTRLGRGLALGLLLLAALPSVQATVTALTTPPREEIRPLVATLQRELRPDDLIFVHQRTVPVLRYYFRAHPDQWRLGIDAHHADYQTRMDITFAHPGRVWLIFSHVDDPVREAILAAATAQRPVQLITHAPGAWLYLAP